jgi:transposase InsO family protein
MPLLAFCSAIATPPTARCSVDGSRRWGITEVVIAPRSPWQNAYVERVIGSIRSECLDHLIIFSERHLRRVLSSSEDYYHRTRTHLSLDKGLSALAFHTAGER